MGKVIAILLGFSLLCCQGNKPHELEGIQGCSPERIEKLYGKPDCDELFELTSNPIEYRYGLLRYFPKPGKIKIREFLWNKSQTRRAIWFQQTQNGWVVLEGIEWNSKIRF